MRQILVFAAWAVLPSISFAQGQALPRLGNQPAAPGFQIQKNGLPLGFGANGFNNNNNANPFNNANGFNAFNNPYNRGFNPAMSPYMNNFGGWNPYAAGYNAGYNPYFSPYNSGFANPGFGYYPQTWQSYNLAPWMPGASPYGMPFGSPYGPGYQLPPWYNGVSPAPIVGIGGPPFGSFPGVQ